MAAWILAKLSVAVPRYVLTGQSGSFSVIIEFGELYDDETNFHFGIRGQCSFCNFLMKTLS